METKTWINLSIGLLAGALAAGSVAGPELIEQNEEITEYKKNQAKRDSVIVMKDSVIALTRREKELEIKKADSFSSKLDSAFTQIEILSNPVVTLDDRNEARSWIEEHNSSIGFSSH